MAKYSKAAQQSVEDAMSQLKAGKLKTSAGVKVKNPKQAIAIGLSEARESGAKVPPAKAAGKSAHAAPAKKTALPKSKGSKKAADSKSTAPGKKNK